MVEFAYKAYKRKFADEYQTASHKLSQRPGILLRLRDGDGKVGFGEIAPIESFGTESFLAALSVCSELQENFEYEKAICRMNLFPCVRFALDSAHETLLRENEPGLLKKPWPVCGLITALGDRNRIEMLLGQGYQSLKIKIGKSDFAEECRMVNAIVDMSEGKIPIRMDANGVLDRVRTTQWMEFASECPVEFIEQPMAKGMEREMRVIARDFPVKLALDESICFVDDLKRWSDSHWEGVYVVKPSIAGSRHALLNELEKLPEDSVVFSSSLESMVGASAALRVAIESDKQVRALGFGAEELFLNDGASLPLGPFLQPDGLGSMEDFEELWKNV
ncbi:MAG: o-succinylbenzoate synthase [Opitutales bacterium]|nr:o-succinylbenzoate synthase [Opitutales bacterium]